MVTKVVRLFFNSWRGQEPRASWEVLFDECMVLAFNGILVALALDGLPILTGGQNVPPEGGSLFGLVLAWLFALLFRERFVADCKCCCVTAARSL